MPGVSLSLFIRVRVSHIFPTMPWIWYQVLPYLFSIFSQCLLLLRSCITILVFYGTLWVFQSWVSHGTSISPNMFIQNGGSKLTLEFPIRDMSTQSVLRISSKCILSLLVPELVAANDLRIVWHNLPHLLLRLLWDWFEFNFIFRVQVYQWL